MSAPAPTMTRAKALARGAAWNYAAQIATVVLQLGYASATSRLLGPHLFGVFAAAMASVTLVNLIAVAGLPQIVGRMGDVAPRRMVGLLFYAGAVGAVASLVLLATADLWALLWGVPESASVLRIMALTSFVTPLMALGSGLMLRLGLFRRLATITFFSNFAGMAIGVTVVLLTRAAEALAVSLIVAPTLIAIFTLVLGRKNFAGRPRFRETLADIRYSGKTAISGILSYWAGNVSKIGLSNGFGTAALGNWNRGEAIATAPFYQLYTALNQAVYPEFRHDLASRERTKRVWSDMLTITGWIGIPLGAIAAVLMPTAVHILFGDGWEQAAVMAQGLAIAGGLQPVVFLLIGGLEALGKFPWLWTGYTLSLVVNLAGTITAVVTGSILPLIIGVIAAMMLMHAWHLIRCAREGLVNVPLVLTRYAEIIGFSAVVATLLFVALNLFAIWALSPWLVVLAAAGGAAGAALLWRFRHRFPPLQLARAYGLVKG